MSEPNGPLTRDGLRLCAEMCSTCIFRRGNLMHLHSGRVREMVDDAHANNSAIVCHHTLDGERAVCRGYWDRHRGDTILCRVGSLWGVIEVRTP